jgi:hypothetical protein
MLTLFVNGSPEQAVSFVNKHDWGEVDQISNSIFPFFCMHGDLELQISPLCQVGKYKAINWAHGDKAQLSSANRYAIHRHIRRNIELMVTTENHKPQNSSTNWVSQSIVRIWTKTSI